MEPFALGRRRAAQQDARHRRSRPGRRARGATGERVRHAAHRLRPLRERRPRSPTRRRARADGRAARAPGRLPHRPPAQDARHRRAHLRRTADARQAHAARREHCARRDRRRSRIGRRRARRPHRGRRARRVRRGTDHRVAAVRARERRRHAAPRRVDGGGAGQGRPDDRRAGGARRHRSQRDGAALHAARRTARATVHIGCRRHRRHPGDLVRGTDRRLRLSRADALRVEGSARPGGRGAGLVRQRSPARGGARARRARNHVVVSARLREPHRAARSHGRGRHTRRGHPLRQERCPAHRRHRRLHRRLAALEPHARRSQSRHARHGGSRGHHRR